MTAAPRLDFTTALFLDLRHGVSELPPWQALTTGLPAALLEPAVAGWTAATVAVSQGAGAGLVARSTLHALIDVFTELSRDGDVLAVDEAAYPTIRQAASVARRPGVSVLTYRHHRPSTIPANGRRVLIATDCWCPGCNRPAPIAELAEVARRTGGFLIVDDSIAFGVLGTRRPGELFGDGTGTIRWLGTSHHGVLWLASMAKAYGTPIAVVTGGRDAIDRLRMTGNRLHASPPSAPDLGAAVRALSLGTELGRRRKRLQAVVLALRDGVAAAGLAVRGLPFPVVATPMQAAVADRWWRRLRADGIDAIVQLPRCRPDALLSFVASSRHTPAEVDRLVRSLCRIQEGSAVA